MSGKDSYTDSAPPLGFDDAWVNNQLKNGSGVDLLTAQILSQKTYDKWTGQGFGSVYENARSMAQSLVGSGIERLEDFGRREKFQKADIGYYTVDGKRSENDRVYETAPDGEGGTYTYARPITQDERKRLTPVYGTFATDSEGYSYFQPQNNVQIKDGVPMYPTGQPEFYNKKTGQAVRGDEQTGNTFNKTYAGDGSTTFNVHFNEMGMPVFYSQYGGSSSDWGTISTFLSVASFIPGVAPFAAALNAVGNAYQGNTTGAILSALAAAGSFGSQYGSAEAAAGSASGLQSVADFFARNAGVIKTAQQGVAALNALNQGDLAGVIGSLTNLAPQVGVTIPADLIKPISAAATASAISRGDWSAAMAAAGTLVDNPAMRQDIKLAENAANVVNAVKTGNPGAILSSALGFARQADLGSPTLQSISKGFGISLSDDQAQKLATLPVDSQEFQSLSQDITKYQQKVVADAETEYESLFGKKMPKEALDSLTRTGDIAGSIRAISDSLEDADAGTKSTVLTKLDTSAEDALGFLADYKETSFDEAKSLLQDLGYANPTDAEVSRFAGTFTEGAAKTRVQDYLASLEAQKQPPVEVPGASDLEKILNYDKTGTQTAKSNYAGEFAGMYFDPTYIADDGSVGTYRMVETATDAGSAVGGAGNEPDTTPDNIDIGGGWNPGNVTPQSPEQPIALPEAEPEPKIPSVEDIIREVTLPQPEPEPEPAPAEPAPAPVEPTPVEPVEPAPVEPAPAPAPVEPAPVEPAPVEPVEPAPVEPELPAAPDTVTQEEFIAGLGDTRDALDTRIGGVQDNVDALANELGMTRRELLDQLGTTEDELARQIAEQGEDFTKQLEEVDDALGTRIGGVQDDVDALADQLGLTRRELLDELGTTERGLTEQIGGVQENVDELGNLIETQGEELGGQIVDVQDNVDALADELGLTRRELLDELGTTETELTEQIQQQGTNFGNLFKTWGRAFQTQSQAQAKAQQEQATALQNQLAQQKQQSDYNNLLNMLMMSGMGGQQAPAQPPTQIEPAEVKSFEELGYGDIFGTKLQFSDGGSVDELLQLLKD